MDDDKAIRTTVRSVLEYDNYTVYEASNAEELYDIIQNKEISLIILDIMLDGEDGLTILSELHPAYNIPVIMLTGKGDPIDTVIGLEVGAEDYIAKPFNSRELLARVKKVIQRKTAEIKNSPPLISTCKYLSFSGWKLDVYAHALINPEGVEVKITSNEFIILKALLNSAGIVLSRDQMINHLNTDVKKWSPYDRSLDVLIAKIRKKLNDSTTAPKFIRTIRQVGYMFIAEVETQI